MGHWEKMEFMPHKEKWNLIKVLAKFLQGLPKLRPPRQLPAGGKEMASTRLSGDVTHDRTTASHQSHICDQSRTSFQMCWRKSEWRSPLSVSVPSALWMCCWKGQWTPWWAAQPALDRHSGLKGGAPSKGEVWRYLKLEICPPREKNRQRLLITLDGTIYSFQKEASTLETLRCLYLEPLFQLSSKVWCFLACWLHWWVITLNFLSPRAARPIVRQLWEAILASSKISLPITSSHSSSCTLEPQGIWLCLISFKHLLKFVGNL